MVPSYQLSMPPRYFLRCLGSPELRGPGGEPIRFRTRKHLALLAFLAVERRDPHRRDRLADLLWPDARPSEGRHSLATALSVIRGKLGPRTFENSRESVRLVASDLEVDLDRLAHGEVLGDETTPPLEVAGFLEEFEVSRAPEYVLWRDLMRAQWFPAIRRALILLMDRCRRTGDFARIEPLADRLLGLDELSEDAIRAKMETGPSRATACPRSGSSRPGGRSWSRSWARRRRRWSRGWRSGSVSGGSSHPARPTSPPSPPTSGATAPSSVAAASIAWPTSGGSRPRRERPPHPAAGRLGNRQDHPGRTAGHGGRARGRGLEPGAVLRGRAGDPLRGHRHPGAGHARPARSHRHAAGVARRAGPDRPGGGAALPHLPPARDSEGEAARLRLTEAVHQLATAVAEEHPLILVVDDVHLADDASVAVLHLLMRRTQEQQIMIVLTGREPELARSPHASRLLEHRAPLAWSRWSCRRSPTRRWEVVVALAEAAGLPLPPAVRRALLRASAGIPMVAELLFDDWRTHGEECLALAVGAMTVDAHGERQRQVLDRVFQTLPGGPGGAQPRGHPGRAAQRSLDVRAGRSHAGPDPGRDVGADHATGSCAMGGRSWNSATSCCEGTPT